MAAALKPDPSRCPPSHDALAGDLGEREREGLGDCLINDGLGPPAPSIFLKPSFRRRSTLEEELAALLGVRSKGVPASNALGLSVKLLLESPKGLWEGGGVNVTPTVSYLVGVTLIIGGLGGKGGGGGGGALIKAADGGTGRKGRGGAVNEFDTVGAASKVDSWGGRGGRVGGGGTVYGFSELRCLVSRYAVFAAPAESSSRLDETGLASA